MLRPAKVVFPPWLAVLLLFLCLFPGPLSGESGSFQSLHLNRSVPLSPADSASVTVRRSGDILAVRTNDDRFLVYDLAVDQELFRINSGFTAPVFEIFGDFILFTPAGESDMTLLNARTGAQRVLPYRFLRRLTEDGVVLARSGHLLDLPSGTVLFQRETITNHRVFAVGDRLFFPKADSRRNYAGYDVLSTGGDLFFSLDDTPSHTLNFHEDAASTRPFRPLSFPVPLVKWSGASPSLVFLSDQGNFFAEYDLVEEGISVRKLHSPSCLQILDQMDGKYLLSLRGERLAEQGYSGDSFTYLLTTPSGEVTVLVKNSRHFSGWFAPGGEIVLGDRGRPGALRRYSALGAPEGEFVLDACRTRFGFFVSESEMLFPADFFPHTFVKVDIDTGACTGMYPFPPGMTMHFADSFFRDGEIYSFSSSRPSIDTPLNGANLVRFDAAGQGWLDIAMAPLDPHAGSPMSTFERTEVVVRFLHEYGRSFGKQLHVTFGGGTVRSADPEGGRYVWETPPTGGAEIVVVPVEVRLGPVSRVFETTLYRLRNPLRLTVTKRMETDRNGYIKLFADWEATNPAPYDLKDLAWSFSGTNLKLPSVSGLPRSMRAGETRSGSVELDLLYEGMEGEPSVRGYSVEGRGSLSVTAGRGDPVSGEITHSFFVPKAYGFQLLLFDPELNRHVPAEHHLRGLRVFDEDGNDITSLLTYSRRSTFDLLTGVAAGLPGKPVRLRVRVHEEESPVDVQFADNTHPKETHPWNVPWPVARITLGPNKPPVADFRILPQDPKWSPETVLDASPSYDPDGIITRYSWTLVAGTPPDPRNDSVIAHRFPTGGIRSVTLSLTDNKGATSSVTKRVYASKPLTVRGEEFAAQSVFVKAPAASYEVTVRTGDRRKSGTDAGVFFALFGPADAHGTPTGSGEIHLFPGSYIQSTSTDPFEKGRTDVFTIQEIYELASLDDVVRMTLRHDNGGKDAGWFVDGVQVKNLKNGKSWTFPANRWLATDEGDGKTYAEFTPLSGAYERGILFGGAARSIGMTEASDRIFILPAGASSFYFTQLEGSRELRVYRNDVLVGTHTQAGQGLRDPLYLPESGRGVSYDASLITAPARFRVQTLASGSVRDEGFVWVLPQNWAGHEKTARQAVMADALIRELRSSLSGDDPYDVFSCGKSAVNVFAEARPNLGVAGVKILRYGMSSLSIFGGFDDVQFELAKELASNPYFTGKLPSLLSKLMTGVAASVTSELISLFKSIFDAAEWGAEFFSTSIFDAPSDVYAVDLLNYIAASDSYFLQSAELLRASGEKLRTALSAFERNDPGACGAVFGSLSTLVIGNAPESETLADHRVDYETGVENYINHPDTQYPLVVLLAVKLQNIATWRRDGHSFLNHYYMPNAPGLDPKMATRTAMVPFEKAIRDMARIAGGLAQICLMGR